MIRAIALGLLLLVASAMAQASDVIKRIESGATINIGVRAASAPFSFIKDGQAQGYVVELCHRIVATIAAKAGRKPPRIHYYEVSAKNRLDLVQAGTIDLECGSTTITETRLRQVEFSNVTYVTGLRVLTQRQQKLDQTEMLSALRKSRVVVVDGTTAEKALRWWVGDVAAPVMKVADYKAGVAAVKSGAAFAMLGDEILIQAAIQEAKHEQSLAMSDLRYSVEPYGIALPKDDPELRDRVNLAMAELYRSGQAEQLLMSWLTPQKLAVNALTAELIKRPGRYIATPSI